MEYTPRIGTEGFSGAEYDNAEDRLNRELVAKHGKVVDVKARSIGETVSLADLKTHMSPQFEETRQTPPVDPNQLQLPGMED